MKFRVEGDVVEFMKKLFFNAYEASSIFGMGFLQACDNATVEDVWNVVRGKGGHDAGMSLFRDPDNFYADYVMGRMMKLNVYKETDGVYKISDSFTPDYQSWCITYKTPVELLNSTGLPYTVL